MTRTPLLAAAALALGLAARAEIVIDVTPNPPPPQAQAQVKAQLTEASAGLEAPAGMGRIDLQNGDRISALLDRMSAEEGVLVVRHAHVREPLSLNLGSLAKFTAAANASALVKPSTWSVHLATGDTLRGNLVELDADKLVFDTWYAGPVTIGRPLLRAMIQQNQESLIYEGPGGQTGWTTSGGSPRFTGDSFILGQSNVVGRELPRMPNKVRIDFELRWTYHSYVRLLFYADKPADQSSVTAYGLNIQGNNRLDLQRMSGNQGSRQIANANLGSSSHRAEEQSARYTLLFDADESRMLVYLDDRQVADWKNVQALDQRGSSISFGSMQSFPVEILGIRISEWDGRPPETDTTEAREQGETLRLRNGDMLSGQLLAAAQGTAKVATSFGSLEIPLDRIGKIVFAGEMTETAPAPGAMRMNLFDGTVLTMDVARLAGGYFEGVSEGMGPIRIPLAGLRGAEWNLKKAEKEQTAEAPADRAILIRR